MVVENSKFESRGHNNGQMDAGWLRARKRKLSGLQIARGSFVLSLHGVQTYNVRRTHPTRALCITLQCGKAGLQIGIQIEGEATKSGASIEESEKRSQRECFWQRPSPGNCVELAHYVPISPCQLL